MIRRLRRLRRKNAALALVLLLAQSLEAGQSGRPERSKPNAGNEVVLFALNDAAAIESLRLYGERASAISPQWFAASGDGNVSGAPSPRLLDACRERRLSITPTVINRDFSPEIALELLRSRRARTRFIGELLAAAGRFQFQGFVIDFENLPASDAARKGFSQLLSELRQAFRRPRLSLAVALPPPSARNRRAFDYHAAGRVVDRVILMAYDQHGRFNSPGPIAGYGWVEGAIRDTIALAPARKLLLGVAFYHRNWSEQGATAGSYSEALALQREHGADWRWHAAHRSHWFGFVRDGRSHTVWVEDARSVAEKLALARRYKLAGVAGWRLGQEDPRIWVMLRQFQDR